jgi:hypothetical protein
MKQNGIVQESTTKLPRTSARLFPPMLSDIHVVGSLTWCRIRTRPRAHADDDVEIRIPV